MGLSGRLSWQVQEIISHNKDKKIFLNVKRRRITKPARKWEIEGEYPNNPRSSVGRALAF